MTSPIRAVFFDLYDTLIGFDPPREVIQGRAMGAFDLTADKNGIDAGYALADALMAEQTAQAPLSTLTPGAQLDFFARYEQLVLRGAGHEVDLSTAGEVWKEVRRQEYGFALYDDVLSVLEMLRSTGYIVGVVTNMSRPGEDVAESMGFHGNVDFTLSSMDVGASKPDPRMFRAALTRAGVEPGEAVHVGDQLETDIDGARAVGINPILIDRHAASTDYDACPRITTLEELPPVLATFR
ncbi:MAG: HAD family hydrolase [Dehalococcoidia bacterium]|nr:HAD family hydrolase [Dehalococcoidia bacterium]